MIKQFLIFLDKFFNKFLTKNVSIMPIRFVKLIAYYYPDAKIRKEYLKRLGFVMDEGSYSNLGLNFVMNDDLSPSVIVGKNVSIAPNVTFVPNSEPNNSDILKNNQYVKENLIRHNAKIIVKDDTWIGAGAVIMPGVTIEKNCIIGAGAVVLRDTEPYSIYAGVPAKKIRDLK